MKYTIRKHLFVSILILLVFLSVACNSEKVDQSADVNTSESKLTAVETAVVSHTNFVKTRSYVGDISAYKQVNVIPLASEKILEFPWNNGDIVHEGDKIAVIRNAVSRSGLDQINAQIKAIDTQVGAAERELARARSLYNSNIISKQALDQAEDSLQAVMASKQQLVAAQRQSKLGLEYSVVEAPITGVVSKKTLEVGDIASSAMALCVLLDLSKLKLTLNVPEQDAPFMKKDQEFEVTFDAYPGEKVKAKIVRIYPYVNPATRTNTVEAEFDNTINENTQMYRYKPGMYSKAEIELMRADNVVTVPQKALLLDQDLLDQQKDGQLLRKVFVLKDDNTVVSKTVELGDRQGNDVEILTGLSEGETLIVRGHHGLKDGETVRVIGNKSGKIAANGEKSSVVEGG